MSVETNGPIRGFLGRWIMRFEASGQMLSLGFQGLTAVSALTGVLSLTGNERVVPIILGLAAVSMFGFAYAYVELGLFNRKNREKHDRGNNFSKPQNMIDDTMIGRSVLAAKQGRTLSDEEREAIEQEMRAAYRDYRNGIELEK